MSRMKYAFAFVVLLCIVGCDTKNAPPNAAFAEHADTDLAEDSQWRRRAEEYWAKGDLPGVILVCDETLRDTTDAASVLLVRARALENQREYRKALADYQAVLRIAPYQGEAWQGLAHCQTEFGNYFDAASAATEAIECGERDAIVYHTRAIAHFYSGNFESALADYKECMRLEPDDTQIRIAFGTVYEAMDDYASAIREYDIRLADDSKDAEAWARRARCYIALGYLSRGIADAEEAISCNPGVPHFHAYLGMLYATLRDYSAARECFAKAVAEDLRGRGLTLPDETTPTLSEEDLAHGRQEIARLLRDRPVLADYVREGTPVWNWIVRRFAGEGGTGRIFWDAEPPVGFDGECVHGRDGVQPAIRVGMRETSGNALGAPLSFQRTLSGVVFEFFNHVAEKEFASCYAQLCAGSIDPAAFARGYLETEELSSARTRRFCCDVFLPWAESLKLSEFDAYSWQFAQWVPFENGYRDEHYREDGRFESYLVGAYESYVYGIYQRDGIAAALMYLDETLQDDSISSTAKSQLLFLKSAYVEKHGDAQELLQEAFRQNPAIVDSLLERGVRYAGERAIPSAIRDFDVAVRFAPANPRAYLNRGSAWLQDFDCDKAVTDYNSAVELAVGDPSLYLARAAMWRALSRDGFELADLKKCVELTPSNTDALLRQAEILVLSGDGKIRDGKAALVAATRVCELTQWAQVRPILLLAAANAEAGNRDEAVKWQKKAAEMTPEADRGPVEAVIPIYEAGKTLRDAPTMTPRSDSAKKADAA